MRSKGEIVEASPCGLHPTCRHSLTSNSHHSHCRLCTTRPNGPRAEFRLDVIADSSIGRAETLNPDVGACDLALQGDTQNPEISGRLGT